MGFLQIALRALREESNILVQLWNQNNEAHTGRIQELVELRQHKEKIIIQHRPHYWVVYQFPSEEKTGPHQNHPHV